MPEARLSMRVDPLTKHRLRTLAAQLELPEAQVVRLALRRLSESASPPGPPPPDEPSGAAASR